MVTDRGARPPRVGRPVLREYLPANRDERLFTLSSLLSSLGTGLFLAGATVFFVTVAGLSTVELGVGLGIAGFVGLAATIPLGVLADRLGARNIMIGSLVWRAGCFVALAFVHGPVAFTVAASCQAAAQSITVPVTQAVVGSIATAGDRVRMMAVVRTVRNVGFSLGALAATPLLLTDDLWVNRGILIGNAVAFAVAAVVLIRMRLTGPTADVGIGNPFSAFRVVSDWAYLRLAALNSVVILHITLLAVGLPLWVTGHPAVPQALIPILVLVNTLIAIVLQVPFAKGVTDPRSGARAMRWAALALAICTAVLAAPAGWSTAPAVTAAVVACVLLTLGELWQAASSWELSYIYATEQQRNVYLSVWSTAAQVQDTSGPLLVAGVVAWGTYGWLGMAGLFAVAALLPGPAVRGLERSRSRTEALPG